MKQMLVATAVIALWLSTLAGYPGGSDVRHGIMLLVFVGSLLMAVYSREQKRAFWLGFALVLLILGCDVFDKFAPPTLWAPTLFQPVEDGIMQEFGPTFSGPTPYMEFGGVDLSVYTYSDTALAAIESIQSGLMLVLATFAGFIAAYIYDQSQQKKDG